jgi:hypothetical protein
VSDPFVAVGTPAGASGHHARFAARVRHWPFTRMAEHVWVDRDNEFKTQLQVLGRQLRFIMALHPGEASPALDERPTFDLRYLRRPGEPLVDCILLGKAYHPSDADAARAAALSQYAAVAHLMPTGYELEPAADEAEFEAWSGADVVRGALERREWVEVRRAAEFLPWTDEARPPRYLPIIYPYRWDPSGWDEAWATLARQPEPALISVSLRPVCVPEADERVLGDLVNDLVEVSEEARPPLNVRAAEVVGWYQAILAGLRAAYGVRVTVLGSPAVGRAVRGAFSGSTWSVEAGPQPGPAVLAEIVGPAEADWPAARDNLLFLEQARWGPSPWGNARPLAAVERLRELTDPLGALCAFRLPLLPPAGLPGVEIGAEVTLETQ